ncbi:Cytochrome c6 [Sphingobium sp. AntQ-1]|uniref:c-type cytochrome n=1 Tax=Sphingobium TaxID=165695 RepID=UPI001A2977D6|nr:MULTISPECIES: cytochrome c [unclassified Sphingobium]MBJ7377247.1 cytochrome c [Sphingobium sp.]WCP12905.1 Cytochrome c6 [Sphingobium sp. AntQ-1]
MQRGLLRLAALAVLAAAPALADSPGGRPVKLALPDGEQVYKQVCAACHLDHAQGSPDGTVPALAHNAKLASADYPITVVMKGQGGMPWFSEMLTPGQVAAVVGYVRTHFDNSYADPVSEADVKRIAAAIRASEE